MGFASDPVKVERERAIAYREQEAQRAILKATRSKGKGDDASSATYHQRRAERLMQEAQRMRER